VLKEPGMTSEDIRSELEKDPFVPFRLHLVSGKTVDVKAARAAWMLQNAVVVLQEIPAGSDERGLYDVVALRNIERLEQLPT
jgi:hypothetical protein